MSLKKRWNQLLQETREFQAEKIAQAKIVTGSNWALGAMRPQDILNVEESMEHGVGLNKFLSLSLNKTSHFQSSISTIK